MTTGKWRKFGYIWGTKMFQSFEKFRKKVFLIKIFFQSSLKNSLEPN